MSAATNNTQRVTFGKMVRKSTGRGSVAKVFVDGEFMGRIEKDKRSYYFSVNSGGVEVEYFFPEYVDADLYTSSGALIERRRRQDWRSALKAAKAAAIAHFTTTEEPAQAETVEVEIPAFKGAVVVPVMANGNKVGHITQVQNEIYAGVAGYRVTVGEGEGVFFKTARAAKAAAEEMAIAHFTPTEEPAQAETVEAEESAQAFAPGDSVIATYKGAQAQGVVVREYVCPDHRKGYPDERFYSSPEYPVYVVKVRGKDREIAYGASHLERCSEAHA